MNLTIDPWIPALRADGRRELFSLQELFAQAHELRDLAVKPHERIALMRLLLCITQAALDGPADEDAWEQCQPLIQPRVRAYLEKWRASFELFSDGPRFLQVKPGVVAASTPVMEKEGITRLNLSMASGDSNATLFDNAAFPTRVGMVRNPSGSVASRNCFPHTRGDGPFAEFQKEMETLFSPHAWGWSDPEERGSLWRRVFPTRVGMVRLCK